MKVTFSPQVLAGTVPAPASKSEAHRRMICAGLTCHETILTHYDDSQDMKATRRCLRALGATLQREDAWLTVQGIEKPTHFPVLDCGESGSTLRFFVPLALALSGGGLFRMHGRLGARPMDVYRDLFVPQGVKWRMGVGPDGAAELHVRGELQSGEYAFPGNVSSQFVSGLMFALPLLEEESTLTVLPPVSSVGYICMTVEALRMSGIEIEEIAPFSWRIPGNQHYQAQNAALSGDYSQAAVLLSAGALGGNVTVTGLQEETTQGDRAILTMLEQLGADVTRQGDTVSVSGGNLHGAELSMDHCPDIVPMLALVCQLAKGESRLKDCGRLRLKECDRLAATAEILNSLGGNARVDGDALVIRGVERLQGGVTLKAYHDHRMVMLASIAASVADAPVTVPDAEALNKSWPEYLAAFAALGGKAVEG